MDERPIFERLKIIINTKSLPLPVPYMYAGEGSTALAGMGVGAKVFYVTIGHPPQVLELKLGTSL